MNAIKKENNLNKTKIDFSVAICVYIKDVPSYFEQSLMSIFNQTIKPSDVVIVIDGPVTTEINDILEKYYKLYPNTINMIRLEENMGHGIARRISLENCKFDLVALMDSDDISVNTRFEKQIEVFRNDPGLSVVGGMIVEFINDSTNVIGYRVVPTENMSIHNEIKYRSPFNQVTVMMRRSHVFNAGGYIDWYHNEDYYLWIRMHLLKYKFANISDVLVFARVGKDMYNRRGGYKYFLSEKKLQQYMKRNNIISIFEYSINCLKRFVVQVVLPNKIRGYIFKRFARKRKLD